MGGKHRIFKNFFCCNSVSTISFKIAPFFNTLAILCFFWLLENKFKADFIFKNLHALIIQNKTVVILSMESERQAKKEKITKK